MAAASLLVAFAWLCLRATHDTSATYDEPGFMVAGYSYLKPGGGEVATANLRFSQMWMALPLLPLHPRLPDVVEKKHRLFANGAIELGQMFLADQRNDAMAMLFASRMMIVVLGVLWGWTIFQWSRGLHDDGAGLITLAFFCLDPVIISNSALATTDIAAALFFTLAAWTLWRLLHRVSAGRVLVCGLAAGILCATKISGFLLVPMAAAMLFVRWANRERIEVQWLWKKAAPVPLAGKPVLVLALAAAGLVAYATLWGIYGFGTYGSHEVLLKLAVRDESFISRLVAFCHRWRLLPEAYLVDLQTFTCTVAHNARRAFLFGHYSVDGWWYFFPVAWLVKTPLSFQLALALSLVMSALAWWRRGRKPMDLYNLTPVLAMSVIYGAAVMAGGLNIGIRHLLPAYPLFLILTGLIPQVVPRRLSLVLLAALFCYSAVVIWRIHPNYLAYINPIGGGPEKGYHALVESSYEWGQDLPAVERWLARRAAQAGPKPAVYFSYFGNADLAAYRIDAILLPQFRESRPTTAYALGPGTYIISATMLESLYGPIWGPWRPTYEWAYRELGSELHWEEPMAQASPASSPGTSPGDSPRWREKFRIYDDLRFGRLCAYLRRRQPDERITYGLLVFELSTEDLKEALAGSPAEWCTTRAIKDVDTLSKDQLDFVK